MRSRFLAIGLIAGLLAACTSGGTDPKTTATPSSSPRTSATSSAAPSPTRTGPLTTGPNVRPGEKPPVYPDLAKQHTANGALAFAAYYFNLYDWGYATNDPTPVERVAESSCGGCSRYINGLKSLRARHGVLTGGRITIVSRGLRTGNFNYKSDYVVRVVLNEEPIVVRVPGSAPSTAAAAATDFESFLFVSWREGGWKVREEASNDAAS